MNISTLVKSFVAVVAVVGIGVVSGCDSGPGGTPQSIATDQQVNNMVEARKFFDKAAGNWDSLTAEDKAQFNKLAGDEAKGKTLWQTMANPMGARVTGG